MIIVGNLSFSYSDGSDVLRHLTFEVPDGACLAIVGANGSGKTTLLQILAGLVPSVIHGRLEGVVEFNRSSIGSMSMEERAQVVSFMQQDPESQIVTDCVEIECAFGPSNLAMAIEDIWERVDKALHAVSMHSLRKTSTHALSYGQKQRLTAAASIATRPSVVIMDEPFSNMDSISRKSLATFISMVKSDGSNMSVVVSTHDMSPLVGVADLVLLLSPGGEQVAFGSFEDIVYDQSLVAGAKVNSLPEVDYANELGIDIGGLRGDAVVKKIRQSIKGMRDSKGLDEHRRCCQTGHACTVVADVQGISYRYPDGALAIEDVSLSLLRGEVLGVMGHNGSGKTTLLKCLTGLLRPQRGRILMENVNINRLTVAELSRRCGVVLQNVDAQLLYEATVYEEVSFALRRSGTNEEEIERKVVKALEMVNLYEKRSVYAPKLSLGERRKLVLAGALCRDPDILVLDEPFFGLDHEGKKSLGEIIRRCVDSGKTVLVVSHDADAIYRYADRVLVMECGKVARIGAARKVLSADDLGDFGIGTPIPVSVDDGREILGAEGVRRSVAKCDSDCAI